MQIEEFLDRLLHLIAAWLQNPESLGLVEAGITAAEQYLENDLKKNGAPVPTFGTAPQPSTQPTSIPPASYQPQSVAASDSVGVPSWLPRKLRGKQNSAVGIT